MFQVTTATKKILKLTKRIRIVPGGTSASKTISILIYLIDLAQRDKVKTLTSVVSESIPHLKRGCIRDFKNILQAQGYWVESRWNSTDSIYTFETGSQIEFFSADNADKLRGGRRDRLFLNEANNMTFDAFEQLEVRTKDIIFIDYNPTNEFWVYTEIIGKRDDYEILTLTYLDNEALDVNIIKSIEQRKNNKSWWTVYGEGKLGEIEGKVYKDWLIIDEIPHEARLEKYGLDFGYTNDPTAIVALYSYNGGFIIDEVLYQKGCGNKFIADVLLALPKAMVYADCAEPKSIEEIKLYGVPIMGANKGPGSVKQGIDFVQTQRISLTKQSVNTIKAYRNYMFRKDRITGKFINEPDDSIHEWSNSMDAIRYGFNSYKPLKERKHQEERVNNSLTGY